jgi:ATP/ADP translocase
MHVGVLHLLAFPIVYSLLGFCGTATIQNLSRLRRLGPVLALISGLTLEIYLVHGFVYHYRGVANLPFPVNLAAFWVATLPLAWIVKASADWTRRLRFGPSRVKPSLVLSVFSAKNRLEAASCDTNRG